MTYTAAWDETKPAGTEARSLGDDRIRELKIQIRERMESLGVASWSADPVAFESGVTFESGTTLPFFQASAPLGWTKSTAHNDKALRVVSGSGGTSGGTSSFSTGAPAHTHTGPSHTHTGAVHTHTTPALVHGVTPVGTQIVAVDGTFTINDHAAGVTGSSGSDQTGAGGTGATGSGGAWVPLYIDVIIAVKN